MPYGKEPSLKEVWERFMWNVRNLGRKAHNPYAKAGEGGFKGAERTAWEDLPHSMKNLVVHAWRHVRGR